MEMLYHMNYELYDLNFNHFTSFFFFIEYRYDIFSKPIIINCQVESTTVVTYHHIIPNSLD